MRFNRKTGRGWVGLAALGLWLTPLGQAEVHVTDNVVVVVDASGSMGTPMRGTNTDRMSVAKDALKQVLGQIPSSTHVGVLVFPNGNWVYPLGPRNDERLNGAIDSITSQGGTPLGEYMKQGADALLEARKKQFGYGTYRLLVVTDGEANDAGLVDGYTPDIISRGITIDAIGVEMQSQHTLATMVHSYRSADDPESLRQAINEVFAEVSAADAGSTGENAFEMIADLPGETASAMLKTLSTTGNEPIKHHAVMRRADPPQQRNTSSPSSTPNQSGPSFDDDPNAMEMFGGLLLMCGCPLLIVFGIYAVVKASKNKG
ncbi:MAG: hypothetical protein CMO58_05890 [Verrucomicrobiales bacterium]|nr:hypothetical protein [Verrucomicrobiales bacterium]